jgi:hypothetical protein
LNIMNNAACSSCGENELRDIDLEDTRIFPNQFLIGPETVRGLRDWQTLRIGEGMQVTAHPDLGLLQVSDAQRSLTLLGYILDSTDPGAGDQAVLQRLLERFSSFSDLFEATSGCGGRWVIVATQGEQARLFTDAIGLRQCFFTPERRGSGIWVGSQPGIMAECLGLEIDEDASRFIDSYAFRSNAEYRWPGTRTPFKEIRHLLPNHYLDLRSGQDQRYWPTGPLDTVSPADAVERLAHLLPALIEAASRRFDLALALTAGWDSRLVLAASRGVTDKLEYMTVRQGNMPDTACDVVTTSRLLARLGLQHHVVKALPAMSAEFSYRFKRSVFLAHNHYGGDAEAILAWSRRRKVVMTGSGAEISRCSFRAELPFSDLRRITAGDLARLQRMDGLDFAIEAFEAWLAATGDRDVFNVLDLFEWEQGHGNWLAMTQLEFDSAWRDIFTPYNCREVLSTLLSVDERYRRKPDFLLFKKAIERFWPEVMAEPINPHTANTQAKRHLVVRLMRRLLRPGIFGFRS